MTLTKRYFLEEGTNCVFFYFKFVNRHVNNTYIVLHYDHFTNDEVRYSTFFGRGFAGGLGRVTVQSNDEVGRHRFCSSSRQEKCTRCHICCG